MQVNHIILPQEIYSEHLETVGKIRFTRREIDIIAYLCSGRSAKTISSFLSITPKTIETHMRNIMMKLECNSRDGIIDFVEKSDKFSFIKKYYRELRVQACFEKQLLKIPQLLKPKHLSCLLIYWHEDKHSTLIARTLQHHLKLVGIKVSIEAKEGHKLTNDVINDIEQWQTDYALCFLSNLCLTQSVSNTTEGTFLETIKKVSEKQNCLMTLFLENNANPCLEEELKYIKYIDYFSQENYYSFVFLILKNLFPEISFNECILEFKAEYEAIHDSSATPVPSVPLSSNFLKIRNSAARAMPYILPVLNAMQRRKARSAVIATLCLCIVWFSLSLFPANKANLKQENINVETSIRPDLVIPTQSIFLDRPHLLARIKESLKGPQDIHTIALVGIGGAGKTTIARYYARGQSTNVTWEINAETKESLINSFENLADVLAKTEIEKKKLKELKDIKVSKEKETKIVLFVREKLKSLSNWLLIYDNVKKLGNIQEYLPHDTSVWGKGRVIILTRDKNIENNNNINDTIQISELSSQEKLLLFSKIMLNGSNKKTVIMQDEQTKKFLNDIPPFPLDVSIAAYYLKATNIPYKTYLEKLLQFDKDFENVQQIFLEEASNYTKTRYGIITLSLQHISNSHKDFQDLLLLISLIDSQNIPRDVLDKYKSSTIVDNFIYHLKKHSFITSEDILASGGIPTFSMHRSTQVIALAYLTQLLSSEANNHYIEDIGKLFKNYVAEATDKEDFSKMNLLIRHSEVFLNHRNLLTDFIIASIGSELGNLYRDLGNYDKAVALLEESLAIYKKNHFENHPWFAQSLGRLGCVYDDQGNYEKAKQLLEQGLVIYRKNSYENDPWFARTLGWLGNIHRELGNYKKAKELFEESLSIYKKNSYENHPWFAEALGRLGSIYREQCDYERAKQLLEESLVIYRKNSYENNPWFARALAWLGSVYRDLGNYDKAEQLLQESLVIYRKNSHENHPWFAWTLVWLGNLHREKGDYEKAKNALEESLVIYKKNHFENHPWFARALAGLGNVHREQGNYKKAKQLFENSLLIYKKNSYESHPWFARTLEQLGNIYRDEKEYGKAKQSLEESLMIYKNNHFENHPWFALVLAKLGSVYKELGDYDKAKDLFERSSETYEKTCGKEHVDVAPVIMSLGLIHMLRNDLDTAETLIHKALQILQAKKPAESHICLECLSDLYLKKAQSLTDVIRPELSETFRKKAFDYLKQALEITKTHFPKNSPHIVRIESKLNHFQ